MYNFLWGGGGGSGQPGNPPGYTLDPSQIVGYSIIVYSLYGWYTIYTGYAGADTGFPEKGGGEDIHKHPPLDIARVTSSN